MNAGGRYRAEGPEAESEPGSRGLVLRNLIGVRSAREMAKRESAALLAATNRLIDETDLDHRFTVRDVCAMHRLWLGGIYKWAGEYRQVNLAKCSFPFAAANLIPNLMRDFERGPLRELTPCRFTDAHEQARALAVVPAELILIHPFREGNGRLSRLFADVMAVQAGHEPLDYSAWDANKAGYIGAIHAGLAEDYAPMRELVQAAWAGGNGATQRASPT